MFLEIILEISKGIYQWIQIDQETMTLIDTPLTFPNYFDACTSQCIQL